MFLYLVRLVEIFTERGLYKSEERYERGDTVIVSYRKKEYIGEVVCRLGEIEPDKVVPLKEIIRRALPEEEIEAKARNLKRQELFNIVKSRIKAHNLPMKLVKVDFGVDPERIICFFTAEGRIDFRELVKDLAYTLMNRVELRQIGVRDEIKLIKGLGPCGKVACCCEFLEEFAPISVKIAKEQGLILNPTKISGICGRLMCCLRFEAEFYSKVIKDFPEIGSTVESKLGEGKVVGINVLKNTVILEFKNGWQKEVPLGDIVIKNKIGAEDRIRTGTDLHPLDPESRASTNSATSAQYHYNLYDKNVKEDEGL